MKMRKMRLTVALILLLSLLLPVLAGCSDDRADRKKEAEMLRLWEDTVVNGNGVGSIEFSKCNTQSPYSSTASILETITVDSAEDVRGIFSVLSEQSVAFSTTERYKRENGIKDTDLEDADAAMWWSSARLEHKLTLKDAEGQELFTVVMDETGLIYIRASGVLKSGYYMNYELSNETVFADVSDLYDRLNNQTTSEN